jgi:hypothetical protein
VRWLSQTADGALIEYLEDQQKTRPFLALQSPVGAKFDASVDECSRSASVTTRETKLSLPAAGDFDNAATVKYSESICADAGIDTEYYLPEVGLVRRVETSLAGPVTYELAYARVNGFIALAQKESSFGISTPSPVPAGSRIFVRLSLRNGAADPLRLSFPSGQLYNLELTDASTGRTVYNWAADKLFVQAAQTVLVEGEKNWPVDFALPETLRPGRYIIEAYLTTAEAAQSYRARVPLEVAPAATPAAVH